jgi:DNA-binding Xre family transcriptional regulator
MGIQESGSDNHMVPRQTTENIDYAWSWFVSKYEARGYRSLNQFAISTGMQKSSLSRYFHLQREIPSGTVGKLCAELKVSPEELLKAVGALGWPAKPKRNRG